MEGRYIYCCLVYVNDYLYFAAGKRTNEPGHIVSIRHNSFSDTRKSRDKQLLDEVKYRHIIIIIFWRYLFVCFCAVNILDIFMLLIDEPLLIKYVQSIFSSYFFCKNCYLKTKYPILNEKGDNFRIFGMDTIYEPT